MHGLAVLLVLPFLHAEFLQSRLDGADSGLWDLATSPLDADNSLSDAEEFPSQNAIGLDDSTFPTPSSLMAVDVDSPAIFSESDPNTISMDQCSSPDGILHRKKLRTRGALCTNHESPRFNQNPSLAGLDASETIIDPDNRRQCDYQFVTLCCLGPPISPGLVTNCYNCKSFFHEMAALPFCSVWIAIS